MPITKEFLKSFREDFAEVVKELEDKYGLVIHLGSISYGFDNFTGKIECQMGANQEEVEKKNFERDCRLVNLIPSDFNRIVTVQGKEYQIVGIDLGKRKYPIKVKEVSTGKSYKCTREWLGLN